ncbi:hypothetical protein M9458_044906, partial [Cirrhinus mrigala]
METYGIQAPRMDWTSANLPEAWRRFKQQAELMFSGPLREKREPEKCSYLLLWIGEKGLDIYNTWSLSEDEAKKLQTYYDKYAAYITPKSNPIYARYRFHEKMQAAGETFEHFITELKLLVKDCSYPNSDEMVRDRIVFATNSPRVREKLLSQGAELTLDKAIDIARSHKLAQIQLKEMTGSKDAPKIDAVNATKRQNAHRYTKTKDHKLVHRECDRCAGSHSPRDACPARGKQCMKCKKCNHFAKACKTKNTAPTKPQRRPVHALVQNNEEEQCELYIDSITTVNANKNNVQAYADIKVGPSQQTIRFKIDSGAEINAIPNNTFNALFKRVPVAPPAQSITAYGGNPLEVRGTCMLECEHDDRSALLEFHIVKAKAPPILGLSASLDLNLIKLVMGVSKEQTKIDTNPKTILKEYADVFQGIREFAGECTFRVNPHAVVYPPRRVPIALRARLKEELDRMEDNNIIVKVTEPTEWVNALVVVEKPKSQKCVWTPETSTRLSSGPTTHSPHLKSVLDARFLRLPFGINSAQDEFQRRVNETYEGLKGVAAIVDDILVYGRDKEEHDTNLRAMLQRTRERGLKLNPDKCRVGIQEVSYFGHRLSGEGISPDPQKSKPELETILGMVNYLARFTPHLSQVNAPLRQLLKQDCEFIWDAVHDRAFKQIKELITNHPMDLTLQVDASKSGLGAVLLQHDKPVAYASKSLNSTEQNYAQIEKELYAVLFGCKRFHEYMYGRKVTVESDHKPLEAILKKPLASAPPRLQRMILQLQKYDIHILHKPGKQIPVADTLSRKSIEYHDDSLSEGMDAQVHTLIANIQVSDNKLKEIIAATAQDTQLTTLNQVTKTGWPDTYKQCPPLIREYWNPRCDISEIDGIMFKGEKIIVPQSLRKDMLDRIHTGHMGMEKCKHRARDLLFWPRMGQQIETMVGQCRICQERRNANTKEPLLSHTIPARPWQVVGTDLFTWNEQNIIIADYYSRYFEMERLNSCTALAVITKLKAVFARHGIPERVISDNGPCYSAEEFHRFAVEWDFKHCITSPRYPQSNGLAEKTVQTAKRILGKARADDKDYYLGLLEYRNTPVDNLKSPAQLLMSRRLRSILPITAAQLQPQVTPQHVLRNRRGACQYRQQLYYNRSVKALPPLAAGTHIRFHHEDGSWQPAKIIQPANTHRSYHIQTEEGQMLRRNRRHLRETSESP